MRSRRMKSRSKVRKARARLIQSIIPASENNLAANPITCRERRKLRQEKYSAPICCRRHSSAIPVPSAAEPACSAMHAAVYDRKEEAMQRQKRILLTGTVIPAFVLAFAVAAPASPLDGTKFAQA